MTNQNCKIEFSRPAAEGLSVSGHGQREAALLVDAVYWKDRVINDLGSEQGRLSAREHQVSVKLISEVAALKRCNEPISRLDRRVCRCTIPGGRGESAGAPGGSRGSLRHAGP